MKCYICATGGRDADAVTTCIACGMGVCMDHVRREEVELAEGGYPFPPRKLSKTLPRMLCPRASKRIGAGRWVPQRLERGR